MTITSFAITPRYWRRHVVSHVVSDISVVRSCWSICSLCSESNNANTAPAGCGTWFVYFASHTKCNLTYNMAAYTIDRDYSGVTARHLCNSDLTGPSPATHLCFSQLCSLPLIRTSRCAWPRYSVFILLCISWKRRPTNHTSHSSRLSASRSLKKLARTRSRSWYELYPLEHCIHYSDGN